jgi:hypothetical protein
MAIVRSINNNEPITKVSLSDSSIPVLVIAPAERRDGQTVLRMPMLRRGRGRTALRIRDVQVLSVRHLDGFIRQTKSAEFQKHFGSVTKKERKDLLYFLSLANAVRESRVDLRQALQLLNGAVLRHSGNIALKHQVHESLDVLQIKGQLDHDLYEHSYSEARQKPAYVLCRLLNEGLRDAQFVVWWMEKERRLSVGIFCGDAVSALYALAIRQIGRPGVPCICLRCGTPFFTHRSIQTYCSHACQTAAAMARSRAKKKRESV